MVKDPTSIMITKDTYEKLSKLKRKMSSKLDRNLTFDELILEIIKQTQ